MMRLSLKPVAECLASHLGRAVRFVSDCVGPEAQAAARALAPGEVLLLENLRFHPGEEQPEKEPDFAARLAGLGDCYVNDAFGTANRAHANTLCGARRASTGAGISSGARLPVSGWIVTATRRRFV